MKTFKIGLLILVCLAFGCKKEEELTGCDLEIDLGTFPLSEEAKAIFPYFEHHYIPFVNLYRTDTVHLNINDPAMLEQQYFWRDDDFDCGRGYRNSEGEIAFKTNNFVYQEEERFITISLDIPEWENSPVRLLRIASVFEEGGDEYKKVSESLFWFQSLRYLDDDEFARIETPRLNLSLFDEFYESNETYEFYPELTLNGKEYFKVFVTADLYGTYNIHYFTLEEGIIGIENYYGDVYTLH